MKLRTLYRSSLVGAAIVASGMLVLPPSADSATFLKLPPWALCKTPTADQCNDSAYAETSCGGWSRVFSRCNASCDAVAPSVAQCDDSQWSESLCGERERNAWIAAAQAGDPDASVCASYRLDDDGQPIPPPAAVVEPAVRPAGIAGAGQVVNAYRTDRTAPMRHTGGSATFQGWRHHDDTGSGVWFDTWLRIYRRGQWADNGTRVDSCREYVYEKYYDANRYFDRVDQLGGEYRDYFEAAYEMLPGTLAPQPWAIGLRKAWGVPLASKDGHALARQVNGELWGNANGFFLTDTEHREPREWTPDVALVMPSAAGLSCGGDHNQIGLCDDSLAAILAAGRDVSGLTGWSYHNMKNQVLAAAGYIDEELYRADPLKARLAQHLYERRTAIEEAQRLRESLFPDLTEPLESELPTFDPIGPYLRTQRELRTVDGLVSSGFARPGPMLDVEDRALDALHGDDSVEAVGALATVRRETNRVWNTGAPIPISSSWIAPHSQELEQHLSPLVVKEAHAGDPWFWVELADARIAAIDYLIEQDLHEARDMGCLEPGDVNPCDWSPRDFAQSVSDLYQTEMEADYQRCVANTGRIGLTAANGRALTIAIEDVPTPPVVQAADPTDDAHTWNGYWCALGTNGLPYSHTSSTPPTQAQLTCTGCNDWSRSSTSTDLYFTCIDAYKRQIVKTVGQLGDLQDEQGNVFLGQSIAEQETYGDGSWGASYAYSAGWEMAGWSELLDDLDLGICYLKPEMWGWFHADATVLGKSVELVKAGLHVRDENANSPRRPGELPVDKIVFEVVGSKIFDPKSTASTISLVTEAYEAGIGNKKLAQAWFTIGPIPIEVSLGVAGRVGIGYDATLHLTDGTSCADMGITGSVKPFAEVEGFAAGSAGALGISAGVKLALTILRIDLPLTVGARAKIDGGAMKLTVNTNLDAVFTTLSGRLSLWFQALFLDEEFQILSWPGLRTPLNLLHASFEIPVSDLLEAMSQ